MGHILSNILPKTGPPSRVKASTVYSLAHFHRSAKVFLGMWACLGVLLGLGGTSGFYLEPRDRPREFDPAGGQWPLTGMRGTSTMGQEAAR